MKYAPEKMTACHHMEYRREVADKIALGFEISPQTPDVVPNVPSLELEVVQQNAA
jgi:hypothetical protein